MTGLSVFLNTSNYVKGYPVDYVTANSFLIFLSHPEIRPLH